MQALTLQQSVVYSKYIQEALMESSINKWGNSLAVRIPRPFAEDLGIREGSAVEIGLENGEIVIRPVQRERLCLEDLLDDVSSENLHQEIDTGAAVGRESW
ncbi:MAG: AbrB/MazE/SpoVT family DNA-binding domain-containing protein [Polyangia bacterium]